VIPQLIKSVQMKERQRKPPTTLHWTLKLLHKDLLYHTL